MQRMLKVKDIQEILGCGKNTVYKLIMQPNFPKIKIGKIYYVPEEDFEKWIKKNLGKEYELY